jgi:2,4-dienoyl-CoA reductase-like NADH-dependent reductase (Old Yellow Enzyme family)
MASEDGIPTESIINYYRKRAEGGTGLIISEGTFIDSKHAHDSLIVPRFETEAQWEGWKKVVEAVHKAGGTFAPQLWHIGRRAIDPIGPSASEGPPQPDGSTGSNVREMTAVDFEQVTKSYVAAAEAAQSIGCDAIEIHGAHGYLLDSFLSPAINRRTDEYGGTLENRMRFPLAIVKAVRKSVGAEFPVIFRTSQWRADDFEEVKFPTPLELEIWVKALARAGVNILHISTRRATDPAFPLKDPHLTLAGWARKLSNLPVIGVGSTSTSITMDKFQSNASGSDSVTDPMPQLSLIESGEIDLLAVGRSLIANPDWVQIVHSGRWQTLKPFNKEMLSTLR